MVSQGYFLEVKQPELEADHLPPSSAEIQNMWSCTSMNSPECIHDMDWDVLAIRLHKLVKTVLMLDVSGAHVRQILIKLACNRYMTPCG